jgi:hypothetical protein
LLLTGIAGVAAGYRLRRIHSPTGKVPA